MGFLDVYTPIPWEHAQKHHEDIKRSAIEQLINNWHRTRQWSKPLDQLKWGDEMEYMLVSMKEGDAPKPFCAADAVIAELEKDDAETWKPEYASYMLEGVQYPPMRLVEPDFASDVLASLQSRRATIAKVLPDSTHVVSIAAFPTMGAEYTHEGATIGGPASRSLLVPEEVITPHVRFQTLTRSVRKRKGAKVVVAPPLFKDVKTKSFGSLEYDPSTTAWDIEKQGLSESRDPIKDRIYMDATVFGFGQSCLQVTFEAASLPAARILHDQMVVLAPLFMALSAAAPFQRGMVSDMDTRYSLLNECVDDRTPEEADPAHPDFKQQGRMPEMIHRYVSEATPESMSDLPVEQRYDQKRALMAAGMDATLADYFAYVFYRDPMIIFEERLDLDDSVSTEHFEGMHSTHWTIVRLKPPPPAQENIHWRVELRTPDVQLTDYENAAIITVATLLARAVQRRATSPDSSAGGQVSGTIPISKLQQNMQRSHANDALRHGKFWWNNEGEVEELSMKDIWCSAGGLLDICRSELSKVEGGSEAAMAKEFLNFIEARIRGQVVSGAQFLRQRLYNSSHYKQDSIVTKEAATEMMELAVKLGKTESFEELKRLAPEMFNF